MASREVNALSEVVPYTSLSKKKTQMNSFLTHSLIIALLSGCSIAVL